MDPTFADMERKRQTMIASFTAVAKAMAVCSNAVNDFALHAPATLGIQLPTINMQAVQPAPVSAPAPVPVVKARKNAAPVDNPAAVAAAIPSFSVAALSAAAGPKRGRKTIKEKKAKDPNAPKRPPSAYLLFQNEVRDEMKAKLGEEAAYKDVIGAIAARWKEMTTDEKKEYAGAYALANNEYKAQEAEYNNGPAEAFAAQQLAIEAAANGSPSTEESSDEDSDESSSDEETAVVKPVVAAPPQPQYQAPAPAPKGSLGAAAAAVSGEKKNKKNQDAAEGPEKKKKKKSKTVEA